MVATGQLCLESALKAQGMTWLNPLRRIRAGDGHAAFAFYGADRPVLSALADRLSRRLPSSPACTHLKGHGGLKGTVRAVRAHLATDSHQTWFIYRTDVKSYYSSIDRNRLMDKVARHIRDRDCLNLLWQYLTLCVERGGTFEDAPSGLRSGGAPSPVLAGFYLYDLDQALSDQPGIFYRRYMDDIIIITKTRWKLRRAIGVVQRHFEQLGLSSHPQKTFMGRLGHGCLAHGISFLGYLITASEVRLSSETLRRHHVKARQLYEQCKTRQRQAAQVFADGNTIAGFAPPWLQARAHITLTPKMRDPSYADVRRGAYEKRFLAWAHGGLTNEEDTTRC